MVARPAVKAARPVNWRTPVAYCQLWKQVGIQAHQILHGKKETAISIQILAADMHQEWIEGNNWDVEFGCRHALTPSAYPVMLLMCRASAAPCACDMHEAHAQERSRM